MSARFKLEYKIIERYGVISEEESGWTKEVNLISWNGGNPKIDIRSFSEDRSKISKGITLTEDEAKKLRDILIDIV